MSSDRFSPRFRPAFGVLATTVSGFGPEESSQTAAQVKAFGPVVGPIFAAPPAPMQGR